LNEKGRAVASHPIDPAECTEDGSAPAALDRNKLVARAAFELLRERRFDEALALLADDGTRWGAGGGLLGGEPYGMVYCFVLRVEGNRVVSIGEYADTAYARDRRPELFTTDSPVYQAMSAEGLDHSTFKGVE
jgi:hypothetical protein